MCVPGLFGSKPAPPPPLPPIVAPPPVVNTTVDNAASIAAKEAQQKKALLAKGQTSTIATSPLGVSDPAQTQKPTLLGFTA